MARSRKAAIPSKGREDATIPRHRSRPPTRRTSSVKLPNGYHPFPRPAANLSEPYTNPDGQRLGRCIYCGFCERFGCEVNAKSSPHITVIPTALASGRFDLRTRANVLRVNLDSTGGRAVGVTYIDLGTGEELEQPAELVCLTSYALNNVRLMLLSGIGRLYDPDSGEGVVGRSYSYYQSTHNCGGAIMGADPSTSALNRYLQSWDVPNVFAVGASAFPQNAGYNPTGTVGALAYWAADAIVTKYTKEPGPLV